MWGQISVEHFYNKTHVSLQENPEENLYKQEALICSYDWLLRKVNHRLNYCQLSQYTASQSQFSWCSVLCGTFSVFFLPTCLTFDAVRSSLSDQSTLTSRLDGLSCWLTLISSWFGFPGVIGAAWPCPPYASWGTSWIETDGDSKVKHVFVPLAGAFNHLLTHGCEVLKQVQDTQFKTF